jgi:hypothetical protein
MAAGSDGTSGFAVQDHLKPDNVWLFISILFHLFHWGKSLGNSICFCEHFVNRHIGDKESSLQVESHKN